MEAIVLAGGLGMRLRSRVGDRPKPMALLRGIPFLEILLEYWRDQGVTRFVLALGHRAEVAQAHFGRALSGVELEYSIESRPLGTGGALSLAAGKRRGRGPVLVLNGDTFFEVALSPFLGFHRERRAEVSFAIAKARPGGSFATVAVGEDGRVRRFAAGEGEGVNGGVYLFAPAALRRLQTLGKAFSLEDDFFPSGVAPGGRFFGKLFDRRFVDIGTPESYEAAKELLWQKNGSWSPAERAISDRSWSPS